MKPGITILNLGQELGVWNQKLETRTFRAKEQGTRNNEKGNGIRNKKQVTRIKEQTRNKELGTLSATIGTWNYEP